MLDGKTINVSRQALLECPQFKHGRRGNEWKRYELYAGACIFKPSLPSPPTSHKTGAKWPAFLGVHAWSDNIGGWILSHFTLARQGESKIFRGLRFRLSQGHLTLIKIHQDTLSALMSLIKSYIGSFRQGNASTISKASGSWAMKLAVTIWGMSLLQSSLLNSSKTKEPHHARSGLRSPSKKSGPFKNLNKMSEKTIWEAS